MSKFQIGAQPKPAGVLACVAQLTPMEQRNYSLSRLINLEAERVARLMANRPDRSDDGRRLFAAKNGFALPDDHQQPTAERSLDSLEYEVSAAISEELGPPTMGGVYVPTRLRATGLTTKQDATGGYLVGRDNFDIVDVLAAESTVLQLGAQFVGGLRNSVAWPLENAAPTATWVAEEPQADVGADDASFSAVNGTPKMLTSTTSYSRKLLAQSSPAVDAFIRRRLGRATAAGLDQASITGAGSNQPTGILATLGVGTVSLGADGAVVSASAVNSMEKLLADSNASGTGLLTTPGIRSVARTLPSITSGTIPLWDTDNRVLGYPSFCSTHMPSTLSKGSATGVCHAVVLADWSNLILGEFGVIELVVDQYSLKKQAQIEVTSYAMYSVSVIRPSAFAIVLDAKVS